MIHVPGFIKKAIKIYEHIYGSDDEQDRPAVAAPSTPKGEGTRGNEIERALLTLAGKTRKMYEYINLEELMEKRGLDWFFPPEVS